MEEKNEYMEKLYEEFSNEIEPTEEMKNVYDEFSKKILELRECLNIKQLEKLEELENVFSRIISLEVKQSFIKGFSIAKELK